MADLGVSIAENLIKVIGSPIIKKICEMWNYTSELEDLNKTINTIRNVLVEADSKRDLTPTEQAYIDELKAVLYDADDLFDEFHTLAELNQLDSIKKDKFLKKVRHFFSSKKKEVSQANRMSQMVKEIKVRLDSAASNHKKFELNLDMKPTRLRRETFSHLNEKLLVGREDDKKAVIDILLNPDIKEDVSFLTILGVGGLGKTTLAKLVYNDQVIQKEFSDPALILWVCVSDQDGDQFDVKGILRKILDVLPGEKQVDGLCPKEVVKNQFIEKLGGKKYLIVLDDVWNEDRKEWLELESLLKLGQRGSRILTTTRSERTATIIGSKLAYKLKGLSQEHSWNLFKISAFDKGEEHIDYLKFVELGKKIVERCHNVPLAIVVVGSLLYGQDISKWRSLEESGMNEIGNGNNEIMSILKLSYHNLDSSLKRCFSYCALFPKDTKIKKEMLISLWMAQGYIVPFDGGCQSLDDAAEEHFLTLLRRCFFQDVEEDEYGNVQSIKIHDLMHDVAQDVGKQELCVVTSNSSILGDKLRHVSYVGSRQPPESLVFESKIRSFICIDHGKSLMKSQIIDSIMCLRVLDLKWSSLEKLPDWIGKLLHLRYLNLSGNTSLEALPDSITKLHNLQTLMLFHCPNLRELPKELAKLVKLRHLDLSYCLELSSMPPGMEKLSNLRVLPYFVVGKGSEEQCDGELEILKSFTNITGSIHIEIGENYKKVEGMIARGRRGVGYLKSTKYLTTLEVKFRDLYQHDHVDQEGVMEKQEGVMEKLEPNSNLKGFILEGYEGKIIPRWGTTQSNWAISFSHLVKIEIYCRKLEEMPSLSKLRYLKSLVLRRLQLEYMEGTSNITRSDRDDPTTTFFPSLESLEINQMKRLKGWWRGEDEDDGDTLRRRLRFPRLFRLKIIECPSLSSFPLCPVLENLTLLQNGNKLPKIVNIPEEREDCVGISADDEVRGLKELEIDRVDYLKSMFVNRQSSISEDGDIPWKSLNQSLRSLHFPYVKDAHLPIVANGAQYLTSLHTLKFDSCRKLEDLPEWIGNLSSLQHLSISCCGSLKSLPESMTKLTSLQHLSIFGCNALKSLPESMSKLNSLQNLNIQYCLYLQKRCKNPNGEDWAKIQHIPCIFIFP